MGAIQKLVSTALFLLMATLLAPLGPVAAQEAEDRGSVLITGGLSSVQVLDARSDGQLILVDFRVSRIRTRNAGADFSLAVIPQAIPYGMLAGAIEMGVVISMGSSASRLLLRPGMGLVGAVGAYGAAVRPEGYLGAGLALGEAGKPAVRLDASVHAISGASAPLLRLSLGVGGFTGKHR